MYQGRWRRAAVCLLVVWVLVTYLFISPLKCNGGEELHDFQKRLHDASTQLDKLKQEHSKLIDQIRRSSGFAGNSLRDLSEGTLFLEAGPGPPEAYEVARRRAYHGAQELWYFLSSQLRTTAGLSADELRNIIEQTAERQSSLLWDISRLPALDGYQEWRQTEAANLSDLVQRRLRFLQNPADCRAANKVVCNLNKGCGFGCQLHHVVYCLIYAYATERTLVLQSNGWRYNPSGWEHVFLPLSDTCTSIYDDPVSLFGSNADAKVVSLPFIDAMSKKPKFLPLAIPRDLAPRVLRFNGDPASWWVGQIMKYVLKLQPSVQRLVNETIANIGFRSPIVGVHVRRTDKVGTEAAFHHIAEYMRHVDEYFDRLELTQPGLVRRVYLATDDANVLEDARKKYPRHEFIGDPERSKTAATHRRYTPASLTGLLVDLHLLSMSDFLVCTFSSQVGRVAYQMMQANRVDASQSTASLDDIFYFGGQNPHDRAVVLPHSARHSREIHMEVGDKIGVAGNHWNGFGQGHNRRTNQDGLFPYFKTSDHLVLYPFPEYKQVPVNPARGSADRS